MSGFLSNMIHRHQGVVDTVQPRIRSMFESESAHVDNRDFAVATNEIVKNDINPKVDLQPGFIKPSNPVEQAPQHTPATSLSIASQQPSRPDESLAAARFNTLDSNRLDLMNAQIQSVLARSGRKSESSAPGNAHFQQKASVPSHIGAQTIDESKSPKIATPDGVEETLNRLKSEISRFAQSRHELPTHGLLSSVASNTMDNGASQVTPLLRQEEKFEDSFEKLDKPFRHPEQLDVAPANQSGTLLVPAWLSALQADLNNRWPEGNAQSDLERVVNVTIGRVEIRATSPAPRQPAAVLEKPKGVFSLDDYLKQREGKGRS